VRVRGEGEGDDEGEGEGGGKNESEGKSEGEGEAEAAAKGGAEVGDDVDPPSLAVQSMGTRTVWAAGCPAAAGRLRIYAFNASSVGAALLPALDLIAAEGVPLVLLRCGSKRREAHQLWRPDETGKWALASSAQMCLRLGPRKAPKRPYPMLAQLGRCDARGSLRADSRTDFVGFELEPHSRRFRTREARGECEVPDEEFPQAPRVVRCLVLWIVARYRGLQCVQVGEGRGQGAWP